MLLEECLRSQKSCENEKIKYDLKKLLSSHQFLMISLLNSLPDPALMSLLADIMIRLV